MGPNDIPFPARDVIPGDSSLEQALGKTYPLYRKLLAFTDPLPHEWKFYGPKHGWQCKILQKKRTLLYLAPMKGAFRIGLAVREQERATLLESKLPNGLKQELRSAKKCMEGYPLRVLIRCPADLKPVYLVIEFLRSIRP